MRRMSNTTLYRATMLALTMAGGWAGHHGGDYLVQRDQDACRKQQHTNLDHVQVHPDDTRSAEQRTHDAHVALASHAGSYAVTQALTKAALYRTAGVRVPLFAQLIGAIVAAVLHALVDDGRLLEWFAIRTNKLPFYKKTSDGINGRALLDQAAHKGLGIPLTAMFTVALATAIVKRRERALA